MSAKKLAYLGVDGKLPAALLPEPAGAGDQIVAGSDGTANATFPIPVYSLLAESVPGGSMEFTVDGIKVLKPGLYSVEVQALSTASVTRYPYIIVFRDETEVPPLNNLGGGIVAGAYASFSATAVAQVNDILTFQDGGHDDVTAQVILVTCLRVFPA